MRKVTDLEVLARNPQLDLQRVADFEKFRREIELTGIDLAPQYRIAPPLGELVAGETGQRLATNSSRNGS